MIGLALAFVVGALLSWFATNMAARRKIADAIRHLTPAPRRPIVLDVEEDATGHWRGRLMSDEATVANIVIGPHDHTRDGMISFVRFHLGYAQVVFPDRPVGERDGLAALGALVARFPPPPPPPPARRSDDAESEAS